MAFISGTKVLTIGGWKNIEDVSGRDRLLVRNFLGDAQFMQPFAIKKRDYSGKLISGGSTNYQFKVTPEHTIVYTNKYNNLVKTTAEKVPARKENRLKHRSRYSTDTYLTTQKIKVGDFQYTVSALDWYMLVGFVLRRGRVDKNRTRLFLALDKASVQKDMDLICPVLDRMGLQWNFTEPNLVVVSQKSNIANKLAVMLCSKTRKKMCVPDKMIYGSTLEQARALIEMFVLTSRRDGKWHGENIQFSTSNTKLIDSLEILGLLSGYTISSLLIKPAGTRLPRGETKEDGETKRDTYAVYVRRSVNEVAIMRKKEHDYQGKVFEVDMFEDQLLIKEPGCLAVWMKPK